MNDLQDASKLFLIFAVVLLLYGSVLFKTGDKDMLPLRAQLSVATKEDVRRVGQVIVRVGLVLGVLALAGIIFG